MLVNGYLEMFKVESFYKYCPTRILAVVSTNFLLESKMSNISICHIISGSETQF